MHQALIGLGQLLGWAIANPTNMYLTTRLLMGAKEGYRNLSPANKAKVDAIMTRAAEYLLNAAVGEVVGWSRSQAVAMGLSPDAAKLVEIGVRRISEVGIAKAREEMRG